SLPSHCASEVLSIVSAIPSLVTLTSKIKEPVSSIEAIPPSEHPSALRKKYPIVNSNFRQFYVLDENSDDDGGDWTDEENDNFDDNNDCIHCCSCCGHTHYDSDDDNYSDICGSSDEDKDGDIEDEEGKGRLAKKVAVVAVQITALCPNFNHVVLPKELRNTFSGEVALAMANGPFLPHANTLSRLIYPE
ncbi:hypothetical protein IW152_005973, partial [Coemansia sp. BCRC 34962]